MKKEKRIKLLDCTLRDGGFALEDVFNYDKNIKQFDDCVQKQIASELTSANIDIVEIGAVEISENNKQGFAIFQNIEEISKMIPEDRKSSKYALMFRGPDTPIDLIPDWNQSLCEYLRVIIRYSELKKSVEYCSELSKKGYKVCVQPMVTLRYEESEIEYLIDSSNKMNAYALYFVDSYGYMTNSDVNRLFRKYDKSLDEKIHIGFHSHNNLNMAFSNVIEFVKESGNRNIIIDSTCLGMGQGAGNVQTEIVANYLNEEFSSEYNYDYILDVCDRIDKFNNENLWGYSLTFLLPAINKTAYKFSVSLRKTYGLSYKEIHNLLKNIPENMRHRFSQKNVKELLKMSGYTDRFNL